MCVQRLPINIYISNKRRTMNIIWNTSRMIYLLLLFSTSKATSVQMRIVKDTASYGSYFGNNLEGENNNHKPTVQPANFTGPHLLERLIGKCYNLTHEQYRYTFCPFQNFSQYELSSRWNAYHGVLGIWSHWNIKNNTFSSMLYTHGESCGDIERSVQVQLECGATEVLVNVTEPSKCQYSAIFKSKYVCHNDSLLVYPRLKPSLQKKWDQLLTDLNEGFLTEKGYHSSLEKLFQSAGFLEKSASELPEKVTTKAPTELGSLFVDIDTCNKEYKNMAQELARLNQELDAIKLLLDLNKIENKTAKPNN